MTASARSTSSRWKGRLRKGVELSWSTPIGRRLEGRLYSVNPDPILVLGNQKAGTSAIAHLLAECCDLSRSVDIPELWPPTIVRILKGEETLSDLAARYPRRFSRDLIKEPHLTFIYPQVSDLWPNARTVFVVRDPRTNIRSVLNRLGIPGDLAELDVDAFNVPPAWTPVFDRRIWGTDHDHYIGVLADRWRQAALVYLRLQERMVLVRYEDFLTAKVRLMESLADRLGLAQVRDISGRVDIQYQPKGDHSVPLLDFFGRNHLRMIDEICGDEMRSFEYHPWEPVE